MINFIIVKQKEKLRNNRFNFLHKYHTKEIKDHNGKDICIFLNKKNEIHMEHTNNGNLLIHNVIFYNNLKINSHKIKKYLIKFMMLECFKKAIYKDCIFHGNHALVKRWKKIK